MISLKTTGPTMGDATHPYDAIMDRPYTVSEFVDEVVSASHNWGVIRFTSSEKDRFGRSLCDYRYGKIIGDIDDGIACRQVKEAWGGGVWSRYDFTLLIA